MISALELYSIGIGPSSSHTVGPMRAALAFVDELRATGQVGQVGRIQVDLFGSLGATGKGHGTDKAVVLGLLGERPDEVDPRSADAKVDNVLRAGELALGGESVIPFAAKSDITMHLGRSLPAHPNAMTLAAYDHAGDVLSESTFYSIGGGFIVTDEEIHAPTPGTEGDVPLPFSTAAELLAHCAQHGMSVSEVMRRNELARVSETDLDEQLLRIWSAMQECIANGIGRNDEVLPGGLNVWRRAPGLHRRLSEAAAGDPLHAMEWVNLYALAVNEENASGGRVVTAPTNGAAGIIPAVLSYYVNFVPGADDAGVIRFLLAASAVGVLFKTNASISGAEVGCQGEVGSACSMAAAGLAEVLGGTPAQVENAAEIGIEHNLGLTCDPIGGLVQIPCIERNAIASVKAINAARMALHGNGTHRVSLDQAIRTMRDTGADMLSKYKETSLGGLAVNVVEC
ncbi:MULTISPECIES: L-serine ammonia-lyase [Microbacterium]|uniref:L-serine ammonia-lyase n=1 Tax=Microbacterium TaxID=33882 RepID=UPI000D65851E|nr:MULTISPECIES: L-serine ammonia-lyase [Microbacterium]